jgi:hypothetical protein
MNFPQHTNPNEIIIFHFPIVHPSFFFCNTNVPQAALKTSL